MKKNLLFYTIIFLITFTTGCVKKSEYSPGSSKEVKTNTKKEGTHDLAEHEKKLLEEKSISEKTSYKKKRVEKKRELTHKSKDELNFIVQNKTGKTIFVVCFSYIKRRHFDRWRWDKSNIYKLKPNQTKTIDIDLIKDKQTRENIYGTLAIFNTEKQAKNSTYELLKEKYKIELDKLYKLKNHKVIVDVEKYGFKGELFHATFMPFKGNGIKHPELDFIVENKTGKPVWVTCFIYQKKKNMPTWKYDKTRIKKIKPGKSIMINVDTISESRNRVGMRGFLAIFDENEEEKAKDMTYELLKPKNKIALGLLASLKNKKIVLEIEQYGLLNDFLEFSIKPIKQINFNK